MSQNRVFARATCHCGRQHIIVFEKELIFCACSKIIDVEGQLYGVLSKDDQIAFVVDMVAVVDHQSHNGRIPPRPYGKL